MLNDRVSQPRFRFLKRFKTSDDLIRHLRFEASVLLVKRRLSGRP
jgi:hypothetical protein